MTEATRYDDFSRDATGWFLGLSGPQLALVLFTGLPELTAINVRNWWLVVGWLPIWAALVGLAVIPVRGRPAARWFADLALHVLGGVMGWTRWQSKAAAGTAEELGRADLPGVLAGVRTHDGPPFGPLLGRPAVVQDQAGRTWAAVARIVHPGTGLAEPHDRDRMAGGLAELQEVVARTELIEQIALQVRTVPDDGAERAAWEAAHTRADAPALAVRVTDQLTRTLTPAAVRTEAFVTVVVAEARIARAARESGGGVDGRARVLYGVMAEVESRLRGAVGCADVAWLDSPGLAAAVRTGFAPGDRADLVAAGLAAVDDPSIATGVPMAAAGPSQALTEIRHYAHDAWVSVTDTILLPTRGAIVGALAPVFVPTAAGERRCVTVFFQPLPQATAEKIVGREEMSAATGNEIRTRMGFRLRARHRRDTARVGGQDVKLAGGRALVRVAAAAAVTVPATWPVAEYGRRLDASIRAAGFTPQRLDLAQDCGFAAACIPLGIGLPRRRGAR
jgi:hypothetical protein